jgi:hypothetical protein
LCLLAGVVSLQLGLIVFLAVSIGVTVAFTHYKKSHTKAATDDIKYFGVGIACHFVLSLVVLGLSHSLIFLWHRQLKIRSVLFNPIFLTPGLLFKSAC